jgi:hypothetical protein
MDDFIDSFFEFEKSNEEKFKIEYLKERHGKRVDAKITYVELLDYINPVQPALLSIRQEQERDIESYINIILDELKFEKEEKDVNDFLKYDNKKGRLYYLDIELSNPVDLTDLKLVRLKVFGKINTNVFNFLTKFYKTEILRDYNIKPFKVAHKISKLFKFSEIFDNMSSISPNYEIKELRQVTLNEQKSYADRKIKQNPLNNKQVTFINPETTRFIKFGKICNDEFYLKNGCMISCFLEIFYKRLNNTVRNCKDLEISNLYKMATGINFEIGKEEYGITLKQATKWCDRFQFELLAIDFNGKIIFQYTPKTVSKKIIGGHLWRILIHSGHVFNITENLKEFDRLHSRKTFKEQKINIDIPLEQSKNWSKMQKYQERTYEHISTFNELFSSLDENSTDSFLTRDADSLFRECIINNREPSNLRLNNGNILSFDVMVYDKKSQLKICKIYSIDNFSNISNQPYDINMIIDKYQQLKFDKYLYELREILTPNNAISTYSNSLYKAFKSYQRGPVVTRLNKVEKFGEFLEIDINRAYCSNMLEIDYIPVFSAFDEIVEYNCQQINNDSFYLIECFNCDNILLNRRFDFVTGELLNYVNTFAKTIKYKILGVCTPYKKISIDIKNKIREIYDDTTINKSTKKNLINILYGICNKTKNKKQLGQVFLNENEAKDNGIYINTKINETTNAYIVIKETTQKLNSGFLPVGRIILDKQRIKLHKLIKTLQNAVPSIDTYGVRTDALYVCSNESNTYKTLQNDVIEIFIQAQQKINNVEIDYNSIGTLKISKKSNPGLSYKIFHEDNPEICVYPDVEPVEYFSYFKELKDENKMTNTNLSLNERFGEFNKLFDTNLTILKGIVGGSGKTYSITNYYKMKSKNLLVVSPYNLLCDDIKRKGFNSITLYKLLGKTLEDFEKKNNTKSYELKGIDAIHFEEIYLYNLNELTWIKNFIIKNNHIKFSAAGDEFQLKPVNESNNIDIEYHNFMIHSMFNNCILLKTSKRVHDELEQKQMLIISSELKKDISGKLSIEELKSLGIKFKSLKDAKKEGSFLTSKHVSFLKQTTEELNEYIHNSLYPIEKYYVEQILLGTGKCNTKPNREYKIKKIENDMIEISSYNKKSKTYNMLKMDCFKYNYANTCHAYQGMSLGDSIYIHNYNFSRVDNRWLYVAITRCSSMNITIVV